MSEPNKEDKWAPKFSNCSKPKLRARDQKRAEGLQREDAEIASLLPVADQLEPYLGIDGIPRLNMALSRGFVTTRPHEIDFYIHGARRMELNEAALQGYVEHMAGLHKNDATYKESVKKFRAFITRRKALGHPAAPTEERPLVLMTSDEQIKTFVKRALNPDDPFNRAGAAMNPTHRHFVDIILPEYKKAITRQAAVVGKKRAHHLGGASDRPKKRARSRTLQDDLTDAATQADRRRQRHVPHRRGRDVPPSRSPSVRLTESQASASANKKRKKVTKDQLFTEMAGSNLKAALSQIQDLIDATNKQQAPAAAPVKEDAWLRDFVASRMRLACHFFVCSMGELAEVMGSIQEAQPAQWAKWTAITQYLRESADEMPDEIFGVLQSGVQRALFALRSSVAGAEFDRADGIKSGVLDFAPRDSQSAVPSVPSVGMPPSLLLLSSQPSVPPDVSPEWELPTTTTTTTTTTTAAADARREDAM